MNNAAEHQEPAEVLSQLGNTSTPQISESKSVASAVASGVLVAASGVVCNSFLFSLQIAESKKRLTSDSARAKTSVSLINRVAFVGQQHEAFGLQVRVVDVRISVKLTRVTAVLLPNKLLVLMAHCDFPTAWQ